MNRKNVLICCPSWGVAPPEAIESRMGMAYHLGAWQAQPDCPYTFSTGIMSDFLVQFSREQIAKKAVNDGFDYIVMVDDDMIVPHDMVDRLLALDVDVVAPLAVTRTKPHLVVMFGEHPVSGQTYYVLNYPENALVECHAVGFGAVCIKTEVLKAMPEPRFFTMAGSKGTGEDLWFCKQARQRGFKVYMDTRIKLLHLGPRQYVGEEDFQKNNQEVATMREELGTWSIHKAEEGLKA